MRISVADAAVPVVRRAHRGMEGEFFVEIASQTSGPDEWDEAVTDSGSDLDFHNAERTGAKWSADPTVPRAGAVTHVRNRI
jgi:hypothetical protein